MAKSRQVYNWLKSILTSVYVHIDIYWNNQLKELKKTFLLGLHKDDTTQSFFLCPFVPALFNRMFCNDANVL